MVDLLTRTLLGLLSGSAIALVLSVLIHALREFYRLKISMGILSRSLPSHLITRYPLV